jgi:hypothetical protein
MSEINDDTGQHRLLSMRVPNSLYEQVAADAVVLGTSISAAARLRLQSGSIPTYDHEPALKRGK